MLDATFHLLLSFVFVGLYANVSSENMALENNYHHEQIKRYNAHKFIHSLMICDYTYIVLFAVECSFLTFNDEDGTHGCSQKQTRK